MKWCIFSRCSALSMEWVSSSHFDKVSVLWIAITWLSFRFPFVALLLLLATSVRFPSFVENFHCAPCRRSTNRAGSGGSQRWPHDYLFPTTPEAADTEIATFEKTHSSVHSLITLTQCSVQSHNFWKTYHRTNKPCLKLQFYSSALMVTKSVQ